MSGNMSRKPILITCQPSDPYFIWQNNLYIESCTEAGFDEERIHILVYDPPGRKVNIKEWDILRKYYPKLNIYRYEDKDKGVSKYLGVYIPILRPHLLWQHFERFPELKNETILYTDCDILWTKNLDIEKFFDDDICYISDAHSYMNYDYFERKNKEILKEKENELVGRDFLNEICSLSGISKTLMIENNKNTGGVQYILKNIDSEFWKKVERDILMIRIHLMNVNKQFYKDENAGIQSWCSDLWAVLFNLWYKNYQVKVIPEMDFAWSSDPIQKLDKVGIFHNAGVVAQLQGDIPVFYKGVYHQGRDPFTDPHLEEVYNNERSKTLCNWFYVSKMIQLKEKNLQLI